MSTLFSNPSYQTIFQQSEPVVSLRLATTFPSAPLQAIYARNSPRTGGRLNKKDGLIRYGDSHVKDKTS